MKPLVLTSKATFLTVRRHKLRVVDFINRIESEHTARHLPFDSVIVYRAGGSISFEAFRFLSQNSVPVIHLAWDGSQVAVTLPPSPISGELKLAQYAACLDERFRLRVSTAIVREKITKSLDLLRFLKRRYTSVSISALESLPPRTTPMGTEGSAAEFYWREFAKVVTEAQPRFEFPGRKLGSNNLGATDPVNSLLNYGYGILEARVRVAIQKVGLDPELGFLHSAQPGAYPLAYDLMELFRWLVDLTTVELIESRSIRHTDFQTGSNYKVVLKEDAAHRLADRVSQNFNRATKVGIKPFRLETVLDLDVRRLSRFILRQEEHLSFPCQFSVEDSRIGSSLQDKILRMTVEQRKELGISKTTYFYMRKRAELGTHIKLYRKSVARLKGARG